MKVWVNGTFDVLHIGHIRLLEYAASLGSLRVGVDTDKRVKSLKGDSRPFNKLEDRVKMLHALKSVNDVVTFDNDTELSNLIKSWEPDYMIVGDDYRNKLVIGEQYAKTLVFYTKISGYSTTNILKHYKND